MIERLLVLVGVGLMAATAAAQDTPAFKDQKAKYSYALGMDFGGQLRRQSVELDPALFAQGLKDALSGGNTLMTEQEARAAITELQNEVKKAQAGKNVKEGEDFLAANKSKEGVITLPSGLQYKILKAGDGKTPTIDDVVVCNYRGTLINGTEFDSSYRRNQPATFAVKGVIKGWTEALQLMPVGSKWQLFIPPGLAYGERSVGAQIGPNSTLIFEVELLSIKDKP